MSYLPLVSIIIPVYNGDPYLREAIDSALNQTYKNIEVIVVNDGSPDDGKTEKIALSYGDKIRYFYKENGGVSTALNFGIQHMKGEWFSWLSHDDIYEPTKIEQQIKAVQNEKNKECVIRCGTALIDKNGNSIYKPQKRVRGKISSAKMMRLYNLKNVTLYGCALLIHKNILNECGFFNEEMRYLQDSDYWTKIMFRGYEFISLSETLVKLRVHEHQMTKIIGDRLAPELEMFVSYIIGYYRMDKKANRSLIVDYTCKQLKEGRNNLVKILKDEIKPTFFESCRFFGCGIFGAFYRLAKTIYKKVFINKQRG